MRIAIISKAATFLVGEARKGCKPHCDILTSNAMATFVIHFRREQGNTVIVKMKVVV